jgi:DNA-binding MarR family transcriptional regulator
MSELSWLEPGELRVFRAFMRSSRALLIQVDRDLERDIGMPRTYFEILWLLNQAPEYALRMNDLAESTGSHPSRITHAIERLEQAGQVRRELCPEDRRGWFAILTDEGLEMLKLATPRYAQSIREHLIEPLSVKERAELTHIGETLCEQLEKRQANAQ